MGAGILGTLLDQLRQTVGFIIQGIFRAGAGSIGDSISADAVMIRRRAWKRPGRRPVAILWTSGMALFVERESLSYRDESSNTLISNCCIKWHIAC
jgi:hypothetical protein